MIGHRGASGDFPENTCLAFDRALAAGAHALELDVHLTVDGVPVVIHDESVDRTTDGTGLVRVATAVGLEELDAGQGERIPRLEQVLDRYPATPLLIEVKVPWASNAVVATLRRHSAERRVVVGSFARGALAPFRRAGIPTTPSRAGVAWALIVSRLGLRAGRPHGAFAVPEYHGRVRVVDRRLVASARRAGLPVHVWTVNQPDQARRLRMLGVCGIITDYPNRMRAL
ncbi:MAG TPA: glycerophosphodiester phosphodiesterase family protein [Gemmatimonadales bacterium]|nr:glycerophosphodiester phosphodiesterase family protein [Gemmatimonadales bacterium]